MINDFAFIDVNSTVSVLGHSFLIVIWVLYVLISYNLLMNIYEFNNVWVRRFISFISSLLISTAFCICFRTVAKFIYNLIISFI